MSRLDIAIPPALPDSLAPDIMSSSDPYIASRRLVEFRPVNSQVFQLSTTSGGSPGATQIYLQSNNGFLDASQSFLEGKISVSVTEVQAYGCTITQVEAPLLTNGASGPVEVLNKFLCEGGMHSAIRTLKIYDEANVLLDEIPHYSKYCAMVMNHTMAKDAVNSYGQVYGDSVDTLFSDNAVFKPFTIYSNGTLVGAPSGLTYAFTTSAGSQTSRFLSQLQIGDFVCIEATVNQVYGKVTTVTNNGAFIITATLGTGAPVTELTGAVPTKISVISRGMNNNYDAIKSARGSMAMGSTLTIGTSGSSTGTKYHRFALKLYSNLLNMKPWLPLRYLRNMRLEIEWNPAFACVLVDSASSAGAKTYNIWIDDLRYVASIVEPISEILASWDERYRSEQGLVYHYTSLYSSTYVSSSTGSIQYTIPASMISARAAITGMYLPCQFSQDDGLVASNFATTTAGSSWSIDKAAQSIDANISSYQYYIGTEKYPWRNPVRLEHSMSENLNHCLLIMNPPGADCRFRMKAADIRKIHPTTQELGIVYYGKGVTDSLNYQSARCWLMADFTKEGFMTGASLLDQNLIIDIKREHTLIGDVEPYQKYDNYGTSWGGGDIYFVTWIPYDTVITIRAGDSGVRKYF